MASYSLQDNGLILRPSGQAPCPAEVRHSQCEARNRGSILALSMARQSSFGRKGDCLLTRVFGGEGVGILLAYYPLPLRLCLSVHPFHLLILFLVAWH